MDRLCTHSQSINRWIRWKITLWRHARKGLVQLREIWPFHRLIPPTSAQNRVNLIGTGGGLPQALALTQSLSQHFQVAKVRSRRIAQHLPHQHPKTPAITFWRVFVELDDFWCVPGQRDVAFEVLREVVAAGVEEAGQAEIANLHAEITSDENIACRQVPVDNVFTLCAKLKNLLEKEIRERKDALDN